MLRESLAFLALALGATSTVPKKRFVHESSPLQPGKAMNERVERAILKKSDERESLTRDFDREWGTRLHERERRAILSCSSAES